MSDLIYGRHAVLETLRAARRTLYRLWLDDTAHAKGSDTLSEIVALAERVSLPTRTIRGGLFDKLSSQHANPQGVALETGDYPYVDFDELLSPRRSSTGGLPSLFLLLDHIQDPQNLGTLFRTAEAMAVDGVLIPDRRAAAVTPAVVNASAGAVEHLRIAQVTNLNRAIDALKEQNVWVAGLDESADASVPDDRLLSGALAVVVGGEGTGVSRLTREKCDFLVRLPMYGHIESLNAAVAGSILLYLTRQAQPNQK